MNHFTPDQRRVWEKLAEEAVAFAQPDHHLRILSAEKNRLAEFSRMATDIFFDFSRQRVNDRVLALLLELAQTRQVQEKFGAMVQGAKVNTTENRAALHTACREFSETPLMVDGRDVRPDINRVNREIETFTQDIHEQTLVGATGQPFRHLVVIGIGGSYLGTEFVGQALAALADKGLQLHFLSNVDGHDFEAVTRAIDPETTLWIIVSKSFTTAETMANANLAQDFMARRGLPTDQHFVAITSQKPPGDKTFSSDRWPVLQSFDMFDFIGGRYSVSSAVGGLPLSLYLGHDRFREFLQGAQEMDQHARSASPETNLPLLAALIGLWNNNFLDYSAQAIIPYAAPLAKLPPHVQQLYMESNGKSVTENGAPLSEKSGVLVFGEPGTNAQHSFFQLAHQGRPFPIDFIGVLRPQYHDPPVRSKGVSNHQELWANLISQPRALAEGSESAQPHKSFSGNRPSSTLVLPDLSPASVGKLLAFYEARTVYEAFLWGINPFDQFGVELGKTLASQIREMLAAHNRNEQPALEKTDAISAAYLKRLTSETGGFVKL